MSVFLTASKTVLEKIIRLVTEQQTEHRAFRFVYYRTLNDIEQTLRSEFPDSEVINAAIYSAMFGSKTNPAESMRMFCNAVDQVIRKGSASGMSILVEPRDYTQLPEVVNIIVK